MYLNLCEVNTLLVFFFGNKEIFVCCCYSWVMFALKRDKPTVMFFLTCL